MELRDLEYFLAVIETASFSRAARDVGRSQQALSKGLARLEQAIGARLLERTPKGVLPTKLGLVLADRARAMLAEAEQFRREVDVALSRGSGQLSIGVSPIAATGIAPPAIEALRRLFPRVRISIQAGLEAHFNRMLLAGEIDLAIASSFAAQDRSIIAEQVGNARWLVVGRQDHPLLESASRLQDLSDAEWLYGQVDPKLQALIDGSFKDAGMNPPRPVILASSLLCAAALIETSDLLAILPETIVQQTRGLMMKAMDGANWTTPLVILRRRRASRSAIEERLAELLAAEARSSQQPMDVEVDNQL